MDCRLCYCTNIHAGTSFGEITHNLERYTVPILQRCTEPKASAGLWLPDDACDPDSGQIDTFRKFLDRHGLEIFTFNAFPFSNFHQAVVKHQVYQPDWTDRRRFEYTLRIAHLATRLADPRQTVSISTLPVGWPEDDATDRQRMCEATRLFRELARELEKIERRSGHRIIVAIEPEPGCLLQTSDDIGGFFEERLLQGTTVTESERIRRYLGICHDICHAAVMFEPQSQAIARYQSAGITIAKVQVSSAIACEFAASDCETKVKQLQAFAEPRYLHQTSIRSVSAFSERTRIDRAHFFEDLPDAIRFVEGYRFAAHERLRLRSHFHVPVFLETAGGLDTTRSEIPDSVRLVTDSGVDFTGHFEIETYALPVSPESVQDRSLVDGIADELAWFRRLLDSHLSID